MVNKKSRGRYGGRCSRVKSIYSNCIMLDQQGDVLFRCSEDRANWYIKRNLAEVISDNPLTMKIKFIPGGKGNAGDIFYCGEKKNKCVVCGEESLVELTKHHLVPYWLRRHFPIEYSNHTSHDILPVCRLCHDKYELHVKDVIKNVITDDKLYEEIKLRKSYSCMLGIASAIVRRGDIIPLKRKNEIFVTLTDFWGSKVTCDNLREIIAKLEQKVTELDLLIDGGIVGKRIVDGLPDIDAFIIFWRKHFVDTMNPQFLPDGWHIDHRTTRAR